MKKFKLFFVVVLALTLLLTACSEATVEDPEDNGETNGETTDVKVGFLYVAPIGNEGFSYAHDQGRLYIEEELGVETIYQESVPETAEVENVIANMVDQGANMIFGTSFGFGEFMHNVAADYPDVAFLHCSGYLDAENMNTYFGRMYEPRFLSGLVAGMKTESNKIGYVAAYEIPEVIRGINAFTRGVKTVNPDAEVHVVWTHTWYDPANEKEAAMSLIDNGADVIAQHQDTAAPQQGAEEKGAFAIGYHSITEEVAPEAYMTAPIWDFKPYYKEQVEAYMNGTWEPKNVWLGMDDGMVLLAPLTDLAPEGAQIIVDEYTEKINNGEYHVFQGPLYDQDGNEIIGEGEVLTDEEMLAMDYFIEGVVGSLETE
jgi:basic membrane protein A